MPTKEKKLRLYNNRLFGNKKELTNNVKLVNNKAPRYIDKAGREFIEVPAIILGNTVIWGNGGYDFGAELISKRALRSNLDQWNDKPVVIFHTDGSARDIENLTEEKVGYIFGAELTGYEDDPVNVRLRVTMRLDVELLLLHDDGQLIIDTFDSGEMMEMSTGYFLYDSLYEEGTHNGKEYFGIQLDIMPDHLALLPNAEGAYGFEDGGGANRNNEKGETMKEQEKNDFMELINSALDEKSIPTKEEVGEMVGNALKDEVKGLTDTLSEIKNGLEEVKEKKVADDLNENDLKKEEEEERKNLITKVKEKKDYSDEILNGTPTEVLKDMLKEDAVPVLGRPLEENTEIKPLGLGQEKEEDKK